MNLLIILLLAVVAWYVARVRPRLCQLARDVAARDTIIADLQVDLAAYDAAALANDPHAAWVRAVRSELGIGATGEEQAGSRVRCCGGLS